jgi:Uma2 family endonuclease
MTATINKPKRNPTLTTVAEFEQWLDRKKTPYNYEFVNGEAIKKAPMKQKEIFIVQFLTRLFSRTAAYQNGGELIPEIDVYIDEYRKRVPDLAFFTGEQIRQTRTGAKVVPAFVIEILSNSESFDDVETKIQDYFDAGVKVVWYINPKTQKIHRVLI